jgi:dimethylamine/trimethylamine dehydrogenase
MRDARYDVLFEPVKIGPVTAPNRFYQVPHCTGMGWRFPRSLAALRGVKAEGGWGVVCTEYCSIHPSSDNQPYQNAALWDEGDVRAHALMTEAVHAQGALAGVELWYGGGSTANLWSRLPSLGVGSRPISHSAGDPVASRPMDKQDIRDLRRWQRAAAVRAVEAGFDIVYVYAAHGYLLSEFLSPELNQRSDEYGGSLENRVRIVRELIAETREAVGDRSAVALRFNISEAGATEGLSAEEPREAIALLADLPDLWDVTVSDYWREMGSSRFVREAAQEEAVAFVKTVSAKPVVGVGRFTSPDTMVRQVNKGILDFIGAARPSIADPFLPRKIEQGRLEDIRECIGCNICYAHDARGVPIRCTQNPVMGEEWRLGWHPETIAPRHADETVLVVGGGPAGLEAARALGQRGYAVTLAEATAELGGRVSRESRLPGLAEWARVRDWRLGQLNKLANVEVYLESELSAQQVLDFGFRHVIVATGARWRRDGLGRQRTTAFAGFDMEGVVTPDDIMAGQLPDGPVLVYDDDNYYMGPVLALKLRAAGGEVTLATNEGRAGHWSRYTGEQEFTIAALIEAGVEILTNLGLEGFDGSEVRLACVFTGRTVIRPARSLLTVTSRAPSDGLYFELADDPDRLAEKGIHSVNRIGDCAAPGTVAAAVYAGHRAARRLGEPQDEAADLPREQPFLG